MGKVRGARLMLQLVPGTICRRYLPDTGPGAGVAVGVGEALGPLGPDPQPARRLTTKNRRGGRGLEMPRKHGMIQ
jgi:hypothetical protein